MGRKSSRQPYRHLRVRANGSLEYYRPIPKRLWPYFEGYLNPSGVIYRVFQNSHGKPEKDLATILPGYLRFHAEIEERKLRAERGKIITATRAGELKQLADKWLRWAFPMRENRRLLVIPPQSHKQTLEDTAAEFNRIPGVTASTTRYPNDEYRAMIEDRRVKVLATEYDLLNSIGHFLKRRGQTFSQTEFAELKKQATAAYCRRFPFLPEPSTAEEPESELALPEQAAPPRDVNEANPTLSEVLSRWRDNSMPNRKAFQERQRSVRQFNETIGMLTVGAITKGHIREFKDALRNLPESRRVPRELRHVFRDRSVPELVELMRQHPHIQKQTPANANKTLGNISSLLALAVSEGFIEFNPCTGMKLPDPEKAKRKRRPFDEEDLDKIFRSPRVDQSPLPPAKRDEWFWLPLLGLFTGARLDELGQLWTADVKSEDGKWYLDINDDGDKENPKHLKTPESIRKVPVRREVIQAGFIDYVLTIAKEGRVRLFPRLKYDPSSNQYTKAFSSHFSQYLRRKLGIGANKVFHSFRHMFADATRSARIVEYVNCALMGHSRGKDAHCIYGGSVRTTAEEVEKITFPKVDLARFYANDGEKRQ